MKINKLEFLNLLRDGITIDIDRFNVESYNNAIENIKSLLMIINETELNSEKLSILNTYTISSFENRQLIEGRVLDDYDIIVYLLDDKTLSFIISTEILTFLNVDDNFDNPHYIEAQDIYICNYQQFTNILNLCSESLEYELEEVNLNDSLVEKCKTFSKTNNASNKKYTEEEYFESLGNVEEKVSLEEQKLMDDLITINENNKQQNEYGLDDNTKLL